MQKEICTQRNLFKKNFAVKLFFLFSNLEQFSVFLDKFFKKKLIYYALHIFVCLSQRVINQNLQINKSSMKSFCKNFEVYYLHYIVCVIYQ